MGTKTRLAQLLKWHELDDRKGRLLPSLLSLSNHVTRFARCMASAKITSFLLARNLRLVSPSPAFSIMIELEQVEKFFGRRRAVAGLNLRVPRGEIFGLLGHNGAGKSTAIGMMLGQVWPTRGRVRVSGFDITTQRTRALVPWCSTKPATPGIRLKTL